MGKSIGNLLNERRRQLRMTQFDLAELAGISVNTLYKIERGQGNPTLAVIEKITLILGLELSLSIAQANPNP
ncbi:helix-turn-helix transcriptional regulator [Pedobacter aquatilis]|uniref:helix-turn-helix domain-containing protein n=1 Tax=Pedobacter aquatilis TaxID=351343 RepID=UPI00292CC7A3|nr:helix-turn-helix transcriptional regulator [Pedobacter aquatilis]